MEIYHRFNKVTAANRKKYFVAASFAGKQRKDAYAILSGELGVGADVAAKLGSSAALSLRSIFKGDITATTPKI